MQKLIHAVLKKALSSLSGGNRSVKGDYDVAGLVSDDRPSEPLSYAVILVGLATADHEFDAKERQAIESILHEMFGCSKQESSELIASAKGILDAYRGPAVFMEKIREEFSHEEKQQISEALDRVVNADKKVNNYEHLVRRRLQELLK